MTKDEGTRNRLALESLQPSPGGLMTAVPRSRRRLVLALTLGLALIALTLGGCSILKPPAPSDLLAEYRPDLRPDIEIEPGLLSAMPRYSITVRIDPAAGLYTGTMEVIVPITGTVPATTSISASIPTCRSLAALSKCATPPLTARSSITRMMRLAPQFTCLGLNPCPAARMPASG